MTSYSKNEKNIEYLKSISKSFERLNISVLNQLQMGALSDTNGKLYINPESGFPQLFPTGTGEILDFIRTEKIFKLSERCKFEYITVIGVSNSLEHCFDCYMFGRMYCEGLSWGTKIVDSLSLSTEQSKIFINQKGDIDVCDPQERNFYPAKGKNTFTNHTVFSVEFLRDIFEKPGWQGLRAYRRKWEKTEGAKNRRIALHSPLKLTKNREKFRYQESYPTIDIVHFETSFTDIFKCSSNFKLFKCSRNEQYYPLIFSINTHSDICHASKAIVELHRKWLDLPLNSSPKQDKSELCQINPNVSLEGQGLEDVKNSLKKGENGCKSYQFPIYICSEMEEIEENN